MERSSALLVPALVLLVNACSSGAPRQAAGEMAVAASVDTPASSPWTEPSRLTVPACSASRSADPMLLRVVDKQRGLALDYIPPGLRRVDERWTVPGFEGQALQTAPAEALIDLLSASRVAGYDLRLRSGFRSYAEQIDTFQYWVVQLGEQQARRESAPPGHSEHQLGTTADLSSAAVRWELIEAFGATSEARWLAEHAHEFGFALSYPQEAEAVTGYVWEPWHIRYVGRGCAAAWKVSGLMLGRFLESLDSLTR